LGSQKITQKKNTKGREEAKKLKKRGFGETSLEKVPGDVRKKRQRGWGWEGDNFPVAKRVPTRRGKFKVR